jgi:hypothetical protein
VGRDIRESRSAQTTGRSVVPSRLPPRPLTRRAPCQPST